MREREAEWRAEGDFDIPARLPLPLSKRKGNRRHLKHELALVVLYVVPVEQPPDPGSATHSRNA